LVVRARRQNLSAPFAYVNSPERDLKTLRAIRPTHEWHLDFAKAFDHFTVALSPWSREAVVVFRPAFCHAWLKAVGAIRDAVRGDGLQQFSRGARVDA
jgi:hypothetical protein